MESILSKHRKDNTVGNIKQSNELTTISMSNIILYQLWCMRNQLRSDRSPQTSTIVHILQNRYFISIHIYVIIHQLLSVKIDIH